MLHSLITIQGKVIDWFLNDNFQLFGDSSSDYLKRKYSECAFKDQRRNYLRYYDSDYNSGTSKRLSISNPLTVFCENIVDIKEHLRVPDLGFTTSSITSNSKNTINKIDVAYFDDVGNEFKVLVYFTKDLIDDYFKLYQVYKSSTNILSLERLESKDIFVLTNCSGYKVIKNIYVYTFDEIKDLIRHIKSDEMTFFKLSDMQVFSMEKHKRLKFRLERIDTFIDCIKRQVTIQNFKYQLVHFEKCYICAFESEALLDHYDKRICLECTKNLLQQEIVKIEDEFQDQIEEIYLKFKDDERWNEINKLEYNQVEIVCSCCDMSFSFL